MTRRFLLLLALGLALLVAAVPAFARDVSFGHVRAASAEPKSPQAVLVNAERVLQGRGRGQEPSLVLRELATRLDALHGSERTRARRILMRPTQGEVSEGEQGYAVPEHHTPYCTA